MKIKQQQDCLRLTESIRAIAGIINNSLQGLTFQELDAMPEEVFETLKEIDNKLDVLHYELIEKK